MNNITGKELIALGYQPAPWFKTALFYLNTLNTATESDIKDYCDSLVRSLHVEVIEPHAQPVDLSMYLDHNTKDEEANFNQVLATMGEVLKTPVALWGEVMPDACPAGPIGTIPVGGVVAVDNAIIPGMHSADICCSLMATNLGHGVDLKELMDTAFKTTQFGSGKRKEHGGWEDLVYDNKFLYDNIMGNYFTKDFIGKAAGHMGTQGDGNHFLFIGTSKITGEIYLITHHGSRGFGASVFKKGMHEAEKIRQKLSPKTHKQNAWIPYSDDIGKEYWDALQTVKDWTFLNHQAIHNRIANKMKVGIKEQFWNEHNFVFKSNSGQYKDVIFHAKGATPVDIDIIAGTPGDNRRIIPLNMSEPILIVKSSSNGDSMFAPHGAGRNFGRSEFQRRGNTVQSLQKEIAHLDVRFYSGIPDVSEYPSAYKNANEVKKQILDYNLCQIVDEIIPYGSIMAGNQEEFWRKK